MSGPAIDPTNYADIAAVQEPSQPKKPKKEAKLKMDPKSVQERFDKRKSWFLAEAARQGYNRALMAKCEEFYDGTQWDYDAAEAVRERGQNPVVYNEVKNAIDWLIGTARQGRVDFTVVANDEGDEASDDAIAKTKLLKYLDECNRAPFERSFAEDECFKAGLGWLEIGLRGDNANVPIYIGAESWRNIIFDSQGMKRDMTDRRFLFRIKVVDEDVALAMFPDQEEKIKRCVHLGDDMYVFQEWLGGAGLLAGLDTFSFNGIGDGDNTKDYMTPRPVDLFNPRRRVLLIECWSREPQTQYHPVTGVAAGVSYRMMCSIMTEKDTLLECWSPFKHDLFPFVPLWAYINKRTGLPYSPILQLIGPQEALNHRMSRSLFEASVNQLMLEAGAIDGEIMDLEEIRRELDDPAGTMVFKDGALSGNKVRDRDNQKKAEAQLKLADRDSNAIRAMSGVNSDNLGRNSNVNSGKAVLAKQQQGGLLTLELFDNLLFARQMEGEITLSLAEQFITDPMTLRVSSGAHKYEFHKINQMQPDGTVLNDITQRKASFVVGEQAWKASYAEAAFESLMNVMTQLASSSPQMVTNLLDVVFAMHPNLPHKKQILDRIREVNGQTDPDSKPTPKQIAAQQQKQQIAQAQFQAQMAKFQAEIKESQAKGEKLEADAVTMRLQGIYEAAQAAQVLAVAPGISPIADELLSSAGFVDQHPANNGPIIGQVNPAAQVPITAPGPSLPPLHNAQGAMQGIEGGQGAVNPALMRHPSQP